MSLPDSILAEIRAHAEREYQIQDAEGKPRESCGLVVIWKGRRRYIPCRNIAEKNEHFVMHPEDYAAAEDVGEVVMVVHSHPNVAALPSQADLVGCEKSGLPWLIVNWPTGAIHEFAPNGYRAPLVGRVFSHGILDCYALVRDYYAQELGIDLPDDDRPDEWWLKGMNLYVEGFERAGFVRVDKPQKHDGLLMQVGSQVPNHAAIYLGDGNILHHQMGRLSSKDVYGGWYEKCTVMTLRHRSLMK
jgi:proteasome lid subunit RPN8/RPN11